MSGQPADPPGSRLRYIGGDERASPSSQLDIRQLEVQYAVWDAYTADRAPFFSTRLMSYVTKYSGTPVFSVWVNGNNVDMGDGAPPAGAEVRIVVYQLVGGDPLLSGSQSEAGP